MQTQIEDVEKEDKKSGFLKRRLVVGSLDKKAENAVASVKQLNLPTFLDDENAENKKNKIDKLKNNKDLMAKKIKNIEQNLMKNKHTRKYLTKFNNSEFVRDMKGIKINIIDPGGQPILDAENNIIGKTDPLLEMFYS
jgi:hypothetical protein